MCQGGWGSSPGSSNTIRKNLELLRELIECKEIMKEAAMMSDPNGKEIAQAVLEKMDEFRHACEGLDEESSSRAPEDRWSPKQIISHLCGPEGIGHLPGLKAFLEKDTPQLDIVPENPYWTGGRSRMKLSELLAQFTKEYTDIAAFVEGLSGEQLSRKARIPMLKGSDIGEYPTLAQWVLGLSNFHIGFHVDHMREILGANAFPAKRATGGIERTS